MKQLSRFVLIVASLMLLVACGGTAPTTPTAAPSSDAPATDGVDREQLAQELRVYNWTDYIDPALLDAFEQEYGVRVIVDNYDANEDMIAKVRAGGSGYDIVVPSDYAVETMWRDDLLQEINRTWLPNLGNLEPSLLDKYFDPGNRYSVPYMYGITGIAYHRSAFPDGITSWAALFDPVQLERVRGQVSMLDDERETPGAALRYLGHSLNATDAAAIAEATALLQAQTEYLAAYNSSDVNRKLSSGEYLIAHAWSGQAMQARNGLGDEFAGNPEIAFVIPNEGGAIWMDNMAILKESPNAYTAHVFIDFLMRPEIAAQNAGYIGYLTPNAAALALLPDSIKALYAEGFAPDATVMQRLEWMVRDEQSTVFTELWTAVKGQ